MLVVVKSIVFDVDVFKVCVKFGWCKVMVGMLILMCNNGWIYLLFVDICCGEEGYFVLLVGMVLDFCSVFNVNY